VIDPTGNYGFEDGPDGEPAVVPITGPSGLAGAGGEPEAPAGRPDPLEVVRGAVVHALECGHRDGCRTRVIALAVLLGLYPSPAEAARRNAVSQASVSRAVKRLKARLVQDRFTLKTRVNTGRET